MTPLRSLGNPDISPFDDVFAATGKEYNIEFPSGVGLDKGVDFDGTNDYITIPSSSGSVAACWTRCSPRSVHCDG